MIILGIETSCDETAAAVVQKTENRIQILSNVVASSASLQTKYGGIIPEQAAREQIKSIIPVIETALRLASLAQGKQSLDAIAVTYGPGLIGSLLVGTETAKVLSMTWKKPLIPINHLIGHFYANWINKLPEYSNQPRFPCIGLLVSGGHSDLVLFEDHNKYTYLGGTRDDAAGECFDKCARLLGLPYPGGPEISRLAQTGNPTAFNLPRPMIDSGNLDLSFSGLKTAVANIVHNSNKPAVADLAASLEKAIVEVLVRKTVKAIELHKVRTLIVAGGVAANQKLKHELEKVSKNLNLKLFIPPPALCTDNAAMIASAGFFQKPIKNPTTLQADPNLALS